MKLSAVRVMLAEDNAAIRTGIRKLLNKAPDINVVGEVGNGLEAIRLIDHIHPDVLLLDIEMPVLNGIEVARQLRKKNIDIPILVLSAYTNLEYIRSMLDHGVSGYLVKDEAPEQIVAAVREVAEGQTGWVSPQVKAKLGKYKSQTGKT